MKLMSKDDNFFFLLGSLLVLFFMSAMVHQFKDDAQDYVLALIILCMSTSIVGVHRKQTFYRSWYAVMITVAVISGVFSLFDDYDLSLVTLFSLLFFVLAQTYSALKQVMMPTKVTLNQIVGSICVYLLFGLSFAFIYLIQLELFEAPFNGLEAKPWLDNLFDVIYFSFITLTTVGYGDVSPALAIPRFFVFLESITGSFYLAIMVASLVSSHLAQKDA
ncbi:two pore domain potassium channel family protein [Vibrio sp. SCSIO 43140]|uniref:potassium channel family protein n=1 Tax=Vibrio sp. SCSIO 43140 TaxID=2819100 RepID=UPI00207502D8|nr:potassium channel family protein [Vibrio sp. SCSIO 43140]USD63749.1 two pore domain potassium channel family protein [Vibrio sp. SCSIO 43140]